MQRICRSSTTTVTCLPEEIAGDIRWENMAALWLGGDHYKWRAMRTAGVDERFCTGDAPDREKFQQYAATMPKLLRNPLYHLVAPRAGALFWNQRPVAQCGNRAWHSTSTATHCSHAPNFPVGG
jgi:glucuronate isomerase